MDQEKLEVSWTCCSEDSEPAVAVVSKKAVETFLTIWPKNKKDEHAYRNSYITSSLILLVQSAKLHFLSSLS